MKKFLLFVCAAAIFPFVAKADYSLWTEARYGDSMGTSTGITKQTYSFYDENGMLVREVQNGMHVDGYWMPDYIYVYEYSDGLLQRYYYRQWQSVYEAWGDEKNNTLYTYDDQGHLLTEVLWLRTSPVPYKDVNTYTWEGNNMVSHKYELDNNGTITTMWTRTYSDFIEGVDNVPQTETSVGQYDTNSYTKEYTYDDQYRVILVEQYDVNNNPASKEEYTYDANGICLSKIVYQYSDGAYVNSSKVERTALGNNQYERHEYSWSSSTSDWSASGLYFVETYIENDGTTAPRNMTIENVASAENPVSVKVTCDEPVNPVTDAQYALWRDWEPIDTVAAVDGKIEFLDVTASLGTHTYYVQTIDATVGYNVTTPQDIDVEIELPAVSNLRVVGGYQGTFNDPQSGSYDTYYLRLAWDAPQTDLEVLHYEIYEQGFGVPIATTEDNATAYDYSVASGNTVTIRVDAVYEYGKAEGEFVTLNFNRNINFETINAMTQKDTYGDVMGYVGHSGISYYLYNADNKIIREYALGVGYDGVITPEHQYYYVYNEDGSLAETYTYQYIAVSESWGDMRDQVLYEYDEQGRLVEKTEVQMGRKYVYTYGDMTETEVCYLSDESELWTKVYSYTGDGLLTQVVSSGAYETYAFTEDYTYDDQNRLATIIRTYGADGSSEKETYMYDERNILVEKVSYESDGGEYTAVSRELREYEGNGQYKMWSESYDSGMGWVENGIYVIERYVDLNPQSAPQNVTIENVSTAEAPNNLVVTAQIATPVVPNAAYVLYRGCQVVDTVAANGTTITFADSNIVNGTYEYIVQAVDSVSGYGYNVSDPVAYTLNTELPEVTKIEQLASTEDTYNDPMNGMTLPVYWVRFTWEAPATEFEILEYRIYQDGQPLPTVVHTDMSSLTDSVWVYRELPADAEWQQTETNIRLSVVYAIGESAGYETTLITDYSSVADVREMPRAYVAGQYLYAAPASEISIYNAGGMLVGEYRNNQRVDLGSLSKGVYVARVKVNGSVQVVKIAR